MLKISRDILDNKTFEKLQEICEDFDNRDFKNVNLTHNNYYVRLFIENEMLINYINNAKEYLIKNVSYEKSKIIDFENTTNWINKVSIETNKNDDFHFDTSDLTFVTYLNNEFEGGELIYIDEFGKTKKIIPKKNMTLIMNDKLLHKVSPVTKGIRYSLVTFFTMKQKKSKTLI